MASNGFTNGSAALDFQLLNNRLSTLFPGNGQGVPASWAPAVSLAETPEGLLLTVELPGMSASEVHIEIENQTLVVHGEKREAATESGRYHLRERDYGPFRRVFRLPRWVEGDRISAHLENGVLSLRLPKAPSATPRRIEIGGREAEN
jgi:HSP20 family protein